MCVCGGVLECNWGLMGLAGNNRRGEVWIFGDNNSQRGTGVLQNQGGGGRVGPPACSSSTQNRWRPQELRRRIGAVAAVSGGAPLHAHPRPRTLQLVEDASSPGRDPSSIKWTVLLMVEEMMKGGRRKKAGASN